MTELREYSSNQELRGNSNESPRRLNESQQHSRIRSVGNLPYHSPTQPQISAFQSPLQPLPLNEPHQIYNFSSESDHEETLDDHSKEGVGGGRSNYNRSRASSPHVRTGSGLGNWNGAGSKDGGSPYGKLGDPGDIGSASASASNLLFAQGDFIPPPSNAFSRFIFKIFASSFLVRWIIYIIPLLVLIWIPGIVQLTAAPSAKVWSVPLYFWSIWLSVVWVGWWAAQLAARIAPVILHHSIGLVIPESKHYIDYLDAVQFYTGASSWAIVNWIAINPLINNQVSGTPPAALHLITQFLFGLVIVFLLLLGEKVIIQVIAHSFHKKSYQDRIKAQKDQVIVLTTLYANSKNCGRRDTLDGATLDRPTNKRQGTDPTVLVKKLRKGVRTAAEFGGTMIGTVAQEFVADGKPLPNSAAGMVQQALGSSNKSKQLARRLFYSFCPSYRSQLVVDDVSRYFENHEAGAIAFGYFDRDGNGDVSLEEIELFVLDVRSERQALSTSMSNLDSAVSRLDSILVSVWWIVAAILMAGLLNASFQTLIAGAGTLILGLSWLFALTAQEVLASVIFLFVKHVYDVGDKVAIDGEQYIVLEMHLLSTIFKKIDGTIIQAPHSVLNTRFVQNIRRSGPISEAFAFDVAFETTFEKIEALRDRMLEFVEVERRDFLPKVDIVVKDFSGQAKLSLSVDINYKSNWQNGVLKAQRRNKFICALKLAVASLEIWGPADAGNPNPAPADPVHTIVSYATPPPLASTTSTSSTDTKPTQSEVIHSGQNVNLNTSLPVDDVNVFHDDDGTGMGMRHRGREEKR